MAMSNPFYDAMEQKNSLSIMLQQIKANPAQFILNNAGINIPQNVSLDPNGIMQYLLCTGKVTQDRVNAAYSVMPRMQR